ncbi:MAG: biotin--[acetyl-CoA-carboxylase] ligase [Anaerolineaceae bacterium]|nr:biotin--[acetyl-CoA-carboxylase] ligase [Anaerolineaceae bacterium]
MNNIELLKEKLKTYPNLSLRYYPQIDSTNTEGLHLLENNAVVGNLLLLTEHQDAGRGRHRRTWISDPDDSLTFSLVITDIQGLKPQSIPLLSLVAAIAVVDAILTTTTIKPKVKWPNDVLINRKKVCGILSEAVWEGDHLKGAVIGIGINLGKNAVPPTADLRYPASSIEQMTGIKPSHIILIEEVLHSFFHWLPSLEKETFHKRYQNDLAFIGESVNIFNEVGKKTSCGICSGITTEGSLIIKTKENKTIICSAGEITIRPA